MVSSVNVATSDQLRIPRTSRSRFFAEPFRTSLDAVEFRNHGSLRAAGNVCFGPLMSRRSRLRRTGIDPPTSGCAGTMMRVARRPVYDRRGHLESKNQGPRAEPNRARTRFGFAVIGFCASAGGIVPLATLHLLAERVDGKPPGPLFRFRSCSQPQARQKWGLSSVVLPVTVGLTRWLPLLPGWYPLFGMAFARRERHGREFSTSLGPTDLVP